MDVVKNLFNTFNQTMPNENPMKRQKDTTPKYEVPRSVGVQYATGEEWRNNSRKNEKMEPKQKQYLGCDW